MSGLIIEDLVVGNGDTATAGQYVSVHYTGWLTSGAQVDAIHLDILRGDRFVVCSDGLSTYFKANEDLIAAYGERPTSQETANARK